MEQEKYSTYVPNVAASTMNTINSRPRAEILPNFLTFKTRNSSPYPVSNADTRSYTSNRRTAR